MAGSYFRELAAAADELTAKADAYMAGKEFIPNDQVIDRIWAACLKLFERHGGRYSGGGTLLFDGLDWESLPWWAAQTLDGGMPYASIPRDGSLGFSLGFSPASQDAHLRNIMEIAEGRETEELNFPTRATK